MGLVQECVYHLLLLWLRHPRTSPQDVCLLVYRQGTPVINSQIIRLVPSIVAG
jgi:hypothetical protein